MQRLKENLSISLIANDVIAPIPPRHHMVSRVLVFDSWAAGHRKGHFEDVFFVSDSSPRGLLKNYGMKNCESFFLSDEAR